MLSLGNNADGKELNMDRVLSCNGHLCSTDADFCIWSGNSSEECDFLADSRSPSHFVNVTMFSCAKCTFWGPHRLGGTQLPPSALVLPTATGTRRGNNADSAGYVSLSFVWCEWSLPPTAGNFPMLLQCISYGRGICLGDAWLKVALAARIFRVLLGQRAGSQG